MVRRMWLLAILMFITSFMAVGGSQGNVVTMGMGHSLDPGQESEESQPPPSSIPLVWNEPIFNPLEQVNGEQASSHLSFQARIPEGLGQPRQILVTHPDSADRPDRVLALVYEHAQFGIFDAIQALSETNQEDLEAIAMQCLPATGCEAEASIEEVDQGVRALLLEGPRATSITWLRGKVRFDVLGPSDTFTRERAIEIAGHFIR